MGNSYGLVFLFPPIKGALCRKTQIIFKEKICPLFHGMPLFAMVVEERFLEPVKLFTIWEKSFVVKNVVRSILRRIDVLEEFVYNSSSNDRYSSGCRSNT